MPAIGKPSNCLASVRAAIVEISGPEGNSSVPGVQTKRDDQDKFRPSAQTNPGRQHELMTTRSRPASSQPHRRLHRPALSHGTPTCRTIWPVTLTADQFWHHPDRQCGCSGPPTHARPSQRDVAEHRLFRNPRRNGRNAPPAGRSPGSLGLHQNDRDPSIALIIPTAKASQRDSPTPD